MAAGKRDRAMYAISRLRAAKNAWCWSVNFRRRGELVARRFYDLSHGGEEKALAAAIAWRDRRLARTKVLTVREFHMQCRSNNTSGVPGVHFVQSVAQPQGAWQAKIKLPDGRKITKSFSVLKFGSEVAFKRARDARAEMLLRIEERPYLSHPLAKRFAARAGATTVTNARRKRG